MGRNQHNDYDEAAEGCVYVSYFMFSLIVVLIAFIEKAYLLGILMLIGFALIGYVYMRQLNAKKDEVTPTYHRAIFNNRRNRTHQSTTKKVTCNGNTKTTTTTTSTASTFTSDNDDNLCDDFDFDEDLADDFSEDFGLPKDDFIDCNINKTESDIDFSSPFPDDKFDSDYELNLDDQILSMRNYIGIVNITNAFKKFAKKLRKNTSLRLKADDLKWLKTDCLDDDLGSLDPLSFEGKILLMIIIDLARTMQDAGYFDLDLETEEGLGLLITMVYFQGNIIPYTLLEYYQKKYIEKNENLLWQLLSAPEPKEKFLVYDLLDGFNASYQKEYLLLVYRYMLIIAKCDDIVTQDERDCLNEIIEFGKMHNSKQESATKQTWTKVT